MTAGAAPGERRGGRRKGAKNKVTHALKAAFQKHEAALVKALLALTKSNDENVRLKAVQACLDRGWGKPVQGVELGADGEVMTKIVHEIVRASHQDR